MPKWYLSDRINEETIAIFVIYLTGSQKKDTGCSECSINSACGAFQGKMQGDTKQM